MPIELLTTPSQNIFADLLASAREDVFLAAPYVKASIADLIIERKRPAARLSLLTACRLTSFYRGSSDVATLQSLLSGKASIRSCQNLHAKVYIFDSASAIVTSANLTAGGLIRNRECGVLVRDSAIVAPLRETFSAIFNDTDQTSAVTAEILETTQAILSKVPKEKRPAFEVTDRDILAASPDEPANDLYDAGLDPIRSSLSGWRLDMFDVVAEIPSPIFTLADAYAHAPRLRTLHPENKNIEPKIRQQLQELRDLGLIEFLGEGRYRKLWR